MAAHRGRMSRSWLVSVLLLTAVVGLGEARKLNLIDTKPNILFILLDDLGHQDLGVMGSPDVSSPNMDRLGTEGAMFTNAYSMGSFCSPARAGAMTGINPPRIGHYFNPPHVMYDTEAGLPTNLTIIPETLKKSGYKTLFIGKWHLGFSFLHHPLNRGFSEFFGFLGGRFRYWKNSQYIKKMDAFEYIYNRWLVPENVNYLTTEFTDQAIDMISKSHDAARPFFMYLAYNAPHGPFEYPPGLVDPDVSADRQPHVAMIKSLDDNIGRIYDHLNELGILENTLIVLTNDNGGHRKGAINTPLRDYKGSWLEGGIRIPFFVYWKDTIKPGQQIEDAVSLMDLYPTFQAVANVKESRQNPRLEGKNIMPFICKVGQKESEQQSPIHETLILGSRTAGMVRQGDLKLVVFDTSNGGDYDLYDLEKDVGEKKDLKNDPKYRDIAQDFWRQFTNWRRESKPIAFKKYPTPNPLSVQFTNKDRKLVKSKEYPFYTIGVHKENKAFTYEFEVFRSKHVHQADFRTMVSPFVTVRHGNPKSRTAYLSFSMTGEWTIRVNVFDGRFIAWEDYTVYINPPV